MLAAENQEDAAVLAHGPVAIDVCVRPETRAVIITGPNMGGNATLKVTLLLPDSRSISRSGGKLPSRLWSMLQSKLKVTEEMQTCSSMLQGQCQSQLTPHACIAHLQQVAACWLNNPEGCQQFNSSLRGSWVCTTSRPVVEARSWFRSLQQYLELGLELRKLPRSRRTQWGLNHARDFFATCLLNCNVLWR